MLELYRMSETETGSVYSEFAELGGRGASNGEQT